MLSAAGRPRDGPDTKWFVVVTRAGEKSRGHSRGRTRPAAGIVIKSIGERLKKIPGIAGATEVGENEIVLVVDVGSLIDQFGGGQGAARRHVLLLAKRGCGLIAVSIDAEVAERRFEQEAEDRFATLTPFAVLTLLHQSTANCQQPTCSKTFFGLATKPFGKTPDPAIPV